jgi:ankyrin repeat protein
VLEDHGDLNLLGRIAELLVYEEKLKVPKAKKGLPIELLEESDAAIFLRYTSLKSICSIISSLSAPNDVDLKLAEAFSCITGLVESICPLIQSLSFRYDDDLKKDGMLKEGLWGLSVLSFILRMNPLALQVLVSSPLIATLRKFATEECFSLHCLQIFEIITLSQVASSIVFIDEETVVMIASILLQATEESTCRADLAVIPNGGTSAAIPGKGKSAKKEKTLPPDANNLTGGRSEKSDAFKQTRRQKLACFKVASHTLTAICDSKSTALTPCLISRLMLFFSKMLLNRSAWDLATAPTAEPYDVDLSDVFSECCIFFGTLGLLESAQRRAACDAGAVPLLMTVMQSAMAIFGCMPTNSQEAVVVDDSLMKKDKSRMSAGAARGKTIEVVRGPEIGTSDDEPNKLIKVMKLRRIAEKSIMNLLTDSVRASAPSSSSHISKRWPSAGCSYRLDSALFTTASSTDLAIPEDETDGKELFPMNQLMDMISCAHDIDLGNRGLRILAGILEGFDDPGSITTILTLDANALNIISNSVCACATAHLASINLNVINSGSKIALPNTPDSTEVEVEKKFEVEAKECHLLEDGATNTPICIQQDDSVDNTHDGKNETLISLDDSSQGEFFYYALIILEKALHNSFDAINNFATKARMASLAQILYKCGATCNRLDDTCTDPKSVPSDILEHEITLHDPRCYAWYTPGIDAAPDRVFLRPLLFDIVGIIACAEGKYRISDMEGAVTGGSSLPSSSPCKEAALIATRICADAVIATLFFKSKYHLQPSAQESNERYHVTSKANPSPESCLPLCVLDAALGALLNMTSMGPLGIYAMLESVVDTGVQGAESSIEGSNNSAMQHLKRFLLSLMSDSGALGDEVSDTPLEDLRASMSGMNRWTRSQYFDQLFSGTTFSTAPLTVIRSPVMWPYLAVTASLIGLISSDIAASSVTLAVKLVMTLCRTDQCADASQPVVTDSFCAFFLSMGGGLALAGAMGRFGSLRLTSENTSEFADFHENVKLFLRFLTGRGRVRGAHWLLQVPTPGNPSDLKSQKAANLLKDAKAKEKEKMLKEQKKGKSLIKSEDCSIVEDVMWNTESDGSHPDPNRGPTRAFWKGLLEVQADEYHNRSVFSTMLLVAFQGGLLDTVKSLIEESAGINISDVEGVTPIMHSLLLGDASSVSAIIHSGADIDAIDKRGNPVITYACHGACIDDVAVSLFQSVATTKNSIVLSNGNFSLLPLLLTAGVDTRVSTSAGNSPLHSILGLGSVTATIGGYTVEVSNGSYSSKCSNGSICSAVSALIEQNALVNACNRMGVVPLHVAAARGHRELVDLLIQAGAHANPADSGAATLCTLSHITSKCHRKHTLIHVIVIL